MVGAVVVRDGQIVGEGYHLYQKLHHAEVVALDRAGSRARGATLYVTLEPCAHWGRTPPCMQRVAEAGIREVFVAVTDPSPHVAGKGVRYLRSHGIRVHEGLCGEEARRLNEAFFFFLQHRRPFCLLKLALTLDGRIAAPGGDSKWITGEKARQHVHRHRFLYDAVLVGVETVLADDPSLDVRWRLRKRTRKVILDSQLRTPVSSRLFHSGDPVWIFHSCPCPPESPLASLARLVRVPRSGPFLSWPAVLESLGTDSITSLIIEGGGRVAGSSLQEGVVQRLHFYYGPKILGSRGIPGVGELKVDRLADALSVSGLKVRRLGQDVLLDGCLVPR
jgi:diaminohydroxyphosphoribosylaminopyrimidine deaminase/5-amino-6-(5-phosphoribosylamino)uracil reductase